MTISEDHFEELGYNSSCLLKRTPEVLSHCGIKEGTYMFDMFVWKQNGMDPPPNPNMGEHAIFEVFSHRYDTTEHC